MSAKVGQVGDETQPSEPPSESAEEVTGEQLQFSEAATGPVHGTEEAHNSRWDLLDDIEGDSDGVRDGPALSQGHEKFDAKVSSQLDGSGPTPEDALMASRQMQTSNLEQDANHHPGTSAHAIQHLQFDGAAFVEEVREALTARSNRPMTAPGQAWARPGGSSASIPRARMTAIEALRARISGIFSLKKVKEKRDIKDVAADMLGQKQKQKRKLCGCCGLGRGRVDATPPGEPLADSEKLADPSTEKGDDPMARRLQPPSTRVTMLGEEIMRLESFGRVQSEESEYKSPKEFARVYSEGERTASSASSEEVEKMFERACCGFCKVPVAKRKVTGVVELNIFRCNLGHPIRRLCIKMTKSGWFDFFFLLVTMVHCAFLMLDQVSKEDDPFMFYIQGLATLTATFLYFVQISIWSVGFGLYGDIYAYLWYDIFNRLDFVASVGCLFELMALQLGYDFTVRALRLFRVFKPMIALDTFKGVGHVIKTIETGFYALATVVGLMTFLFMAFAILGMNAYKGSYRRRCVWADTLELKIPEQWCEDMDEKFLIIPDSSARYGLNHNCGPLQRCVPFGNPNNGFTSFDDIASSMITLFQAFSTDGQYQVMWAAYQSEPGWLVFTIFYFVSMSLLLGQVIINVFVAVLAGVFSQVREEDAEEDEEESEGSLSSTSSMSGDGSRSSVVEDLDEKADTASPADVTLDGGSAGSERDESKDVKMEYLDQKEVIPNQPGTAEGTKALNVAKMMHKKPAGRALLSEKLSYVFRSEVYGYFLLTIILTNVAAICLSGAFTPEIDDILVEIEKWFSLAFFIELIIQIMCDGSFYKYVKQGQHVFDLLCAIPTSLAFMAQVCGATTENTSTLRKLAILRIMRACKYGFLKPLGRMLATTASSFLPIMNLILVIIAFLVAWLVVGKGLLGGKLDDDYANFNTFYRGFLTLFQIFTGDSWSGLMYVAMYTACEEYECIEMVSGVCQECHMGAGAIAAYYIIMFCAGQYIFVTLFLGIILSNFSVLDFMGERQGADKMIDREEAISLISKFQKLPPAYISQKLVDYVFRRLSPDDDAELVAAHVPKAKLMELVAWKQPKRMWRIAKSLGIIRIRAIIRARLCCCLQFLKCCRPWPGDDPEDWIPERKRKKLVVPDKELDRMIFERKADELRSLLKRIEMGGMVGEIQIIAKQEGFQDRLPTRLRDADLDVALMIVRDPTIVKRLNIFEPDFSREEQLHMLIAAEKRKRPAYVDNFIGEPKERVAPVGGPWFIMRYYQITTSVHRFILALGTSMIFEFVVMSSIIVSTVFLAMTTPAKEIPGPLPTSVETLGSWIFSGVFLLEALNRILAFGFFRPLNKGFPAYWEDGWNRIDFFVLVFAMADLLGLGNYLGQNAMRMIKSARALRPIRLLGRSKGARQIITALGGSLMPILYALSFLLLFTLCFCVVGMSFFKDKLLACSDGSIDGSLNEGKLECSGLFYVDEVLKQRTWESPMSNFDSAYSAFLTLCRVFTLKWVSTWILVQDTASKPNIQPVMHNYTVPASSFMILFIFFGSFFCLNLFVSFIVDGFYAAQGVEAQSESIKYAMIMKMVGEHWPKKILKPPQHPVSQATRAIVTHKVFLYTSAAGTLINVLSMAASYYGEDEAMRSFQDTQNNFFFYFMVVEVFLTFIAYGTQNFFASYWNWFDMALISGTAVTIVYLESFRGSVQVLRLGRLFRFVRQVVTNKLINSVFDTIILSLGQVVNLVMILFIVMSVFAILGVQTFGTTRWGARLGPQANFETYWRAFLTLFQILFGDEWHQLMEDTQVEWPNCDKFFVLADGTQLSYGDCGTGYSPPFFLMFIIGCNFTMLNLFVGMIINNFSFVHESEDILVSHENLANISHIWVERYDTRATGCINIGQVWGLMTHIDEPLGFYGTEANHGRYLCIRNQLERVMLMREELEHAPTFFSSIYDRLHDMETEMVTLMMHQFKTLHKVADEWGKIRLEHMRQWKKKGTSSSGDDEEPMELLPEEVSDEDEDDYDEWEEEEVMGGNFGAAVLDEAAWQGPRRPAEVWVAGGNMGQKKRGPKTVKKKKTSSKSSSQAITEQLNSKIREAERARRKQIMDEQELEEKWQLAQKMRHPKQPWKLRLVSIARAFFGSFLEQSSRVKSKEGQVTYPEVMDALLYWNKKSGVVPRRIAEQRQDLDAQIISDVALQLIQSLMIGYKERKRARLLKKMRTKVAMHARAQGFHSAIERARAEKVAEDEALRFTNETRLKQYAERCSAGVLFHEMGKVVTRKNGLVDFDALCAKIVTVGIATPEQLEAACKRAGVALQLQPSGFCGIDDPKEEDKIMGTKDSELRGWITRAVGHDKLVQAVHAMVEDPDKMSVITQISELDHIPRDWQLHLCSEESLNFFVKFPAVANVLDLEAKQSNGTKGAKAAVKSLLDKNDMEKSVLAALTKGNKKETREAAALAAMELAQEKERAQELIDRTEREGQELLSVLKIAEKRLAEEHAERDRLEERARQSASRFHASAAEAAEHARAEAEERSRAKAEDAEAAARRGEIREKLYGAAQRERVGYASTLASQFATGTEMGQPVSPGSAAGSAAEGGSSSSEDERERGFERTLSQVIEEDTTETFERQASEEALARTASHESCSSRVSAREGHFGSAGTRQGSVPGSVSGSATGSGSRSGSGSGAKDSSKVLPTYPEQPDQIRRRLERQRAELRKLQSQLGRAQFQPDHDEIERKARIDRANARREKRAIAGLSSTTQAGALGIEPPAVSNTMDEAGGGRGLRVAKKQPGWL